MVTSKGEQVKFEWLNAKIQFIKYFKAKQRSLDPQGVATSIVKPLEESKNEEESKLDGREPDTILKDIY